MKKVSNGPCVHSSQTAALVIEKQVHRGDLPDWIPSLWTGEASICQVNTTTAVKIRFPPSFSSQRVFCILKTCEFHSHSLTVEPFKTEIISWKCSYQKLLNASFLRWSDSRWLPSVLSLLQHPSFQGSLYSLQSSRSVTGEDTGSNSHCIMC